MNQLSLTDERNKEQVPSVLGRDEKPMSRGQE